MKFRHVAARFGASTLLSLAAASCAPAGAVDEPMVAGGGEASDIADDDIVGANAVGRNITPSAAALSDPDHQVTLGEVNRHFLPVVLRLTAITATSRTTSYPDYHRLFGGERFIAYSFFGINESETDANDYGAKNYFTFLRTVTQAQPNLRVTNVSDGSNLLAVQWNGAAVPNVTVERVLGWILDNRDLPAGVTSSNRDQFRLQVLRQWRDKQITLGMTAAVTINGGAHNVAVEIRTFYGNEEGFSAGYAAQRRYIAAFADASVFQYTGHSHLGSGPLDSRNYRDAQFPDAYQIMMVNSCVSFNYYNDFFAMHPGGTRNLDTVTNGLPVFLEGSGLSSARFIVGLIDGRFRSYNDTLASMRVDLPWEQGHDANRVADGETDNEFRPSTTRMTITTTAPTTR